MFNKYWLIHLQDSILARHSWFVRWELSDRTAAILSDATSGKYSKQLVAFVCTSYVVFSSMCFACVRVVQLYGSTEVLFYY